MFVACDERFIEIFMEQLNKIDDITNRIINQRMLLIMSNEIDPVLASLFQFKGTHWYDNKLALNEAASSNNINAIQWLIEC